MKYKKICNYPIEENTYIVYDEEKKNSFIVDPFEASSVKSFLEKEGLLPDYIFLTHEHIDHIKGINEIIKQYRCKTICSEECSRKICDSRENLSMYFQILLSVNSKIKISEDYISSQKPFEANAPGDIVFDEKLQIEWCGHMIKCISTPGHTSASICILIDNKMIFTGDSLIREQDTVTNLPTGSKKDYTQKTIPIFRNLCKETIILPGHGEEFLLKEKYDFLFGEKYD